MQSLGEDARECPANFVNMPLNSRSLGELGSEGYAPNMVWYITEKTHTSPEKNPVLLPHHHSGEICLGYRRHCIASFY